MAFAGAAAFSVSAKSPTAAIAGVCCCCCGCFLAKSCLLSGERIRAVLGFRTAQLQSNDRKSQSRFLKEGGNLLTTAVTCQCAQWGEGGSNLVSGGEVSRKILFCQCYYISNYN